MLVHKTVGRGDDVLRPRAVRSANPHVDARDLVAKTVGRGTMLADKDSGARGA